MTTFRFGIMGAGNIANRFCEAVKQIKDCEVAAVSSKSKERAESFARKHGIEKAYDSYEEMLKDAGLDAVYIAATSNAHYSLTMLCLDYKTPVLCEKAMFLNSREAETAFQRSEKENVFVMEAMWSRFLPAVRKAREWMREKKIGELAYADAAIGFLAPRDFSNRYYNPQLGGGAAFDLTVYTYELLTFLIEQERKDMQIQAVFSESGVDVSEHIQIQYETALASMKTTFLANLQQELVLYGDKGKIVLPRPHFASEAFLYDEKGNVKEHFVDESGRDGFTYEIEEVIRCVRQGKIESDTVPHSLTLECAGVFDEIYKKKP